MTRHFVDIASIESAELSELLDLSAQIKHAHFHGRSEFPLKGRSLALFFEKPSLRTRVSFEAAMAQLGGTSIFIQAQEVGIGTRESVEDFARVVSQYVDILVARVFDHNLVVDLSRHAAVPIVNGLSDLSHPCQALGDLLTIQEICGEVEGKKVVFIGDGNNVARSLSAGCVKLGCRFVLCAPTSYLFADDYLNLLNSWGSGLATMTSDPSSAVDGADIVYTDVWTSMGQEAEAQRRRADFAGYQVNEEIMKSAPQAARVMHCLPAHRGEEITDGVIDGDQSVVLTQAANRLHAQKGLLSWLSDQWQYPIRKGS